MMRVTNNSIISRYLDNLNKSLGNLNTLSEKVSSGRRYNRASEDTASSIKALRVRRDISRNTIYMNNIRDAQGTLDEAETALNNIKELITQAHERVQQGITGTANDENKDIIAGILKDLQQQILQIGNSSFGGKYIFGGSNTKQAPFTADTSGKLLYNGIDLDTGVFPGQAVYTDLGLGLGLDASGEVKKNTAFDVSLPGNEIMGCGLDSDSLPNNAFNLIGQIANKLETNNLTDINKYLDKLGSSAENILAQVVNVGEKGKFIGFLKERYEYKEINLFNKQTDLESIDSAKGILDFKTQEMAYQAALQMGSRLIQPSLMDFLR